MNGLGRRLSAYYASIASSLGELWLARTERGLCRVGLSVAETDWLGTLAQELGLTPRRDVKPFAEAIRQFAEYFEGRRRSFDLPLDLAGSPFQRQVWAATREIPFGQVRSYGEIAQVIGAPKAMRAVGGALGRNPVLVLVPCHRVLRADGMLGGFAAGLEIKSQLLTLEGHVQFR